ncbi:hypothetical protein CAOG_07132 [Capsaspora owczarzaki ATCC 30864]|uniref:Uncharacterized protein n=1 Tax=Capsaspora owczarzaki (strain ATCC 30864) TaxID=595528 RepID=A0A0D2X4Y7_CAPO3|nr:hypothetical protein CAOG_07132 [Capsaspora owczarzaki ATCC 30864]KJE96879.1 hypothetical protein CAOG_007132 [Capsaspora owczarzaki ATCC 30864]|eukprot:XP_004343856.2 hypothetical protein CAOG_07132 [Capsaspora owczarzaki ATCC 30864]
MLTMGILAAPKPVKASSAHSQPQSRQQSPSPKLLQQPRPASAAVLIQPQPSAATNSNSNSARPRVQPLTVSNPVAVPSTRARAIPNHGSFDSDSHAELQGILLQHGATSADARALFPASPPTRAANPMAMNDPFFMPHHQPGVELGLLSPSPPPTALAASSIRAMANSPTKGFPLHQTPPLQYRHNNQHDEGFFVGSPSQQSMIYSVNGHSHHHHHTGGVDNLVYANTSFSGSHPFSGVGSHPGSSGLSLTIPPTALGMASSGNGSGTASPNPSSPLSPRSYSRARFGRKVVAQQAPPPSSTNRAQGRKKAHSFGDEPLPSL